MKTNFYHSHKVNNLETFPKHPCSEVCVLEETKMAHGSREKKLYFQGEARSRLKILEISNQKPAGDACDHLRGGA